MSSEGEHKITALSLLADKALARQNIIFVSTSSWLLEKPVISDAN